MDSEIGSVTSCSVTESTERSSSLSLLSVLKVAPNSSCMALLRKLKNPCITQLLSITILNKQISVKFSFIYPLKQIGVLYFMRNESYTFSLLLKIPNMLLLLASYIFFRMTLTLSSTIKRS